MLLRKTVYQQKTIMFLDEFHWTYINLILKSITVFNFIFTN
jgi:hypothetical protein